MPYSQLLTEAFPNRPTTGPSQFGAQAIQNALERLGYHRRIALRKPVLTPQNRALRLAWAWEHLLWEDADWDKVIWSDETWVKSWRHRKTWITRMPGEELEDTCIAEKPQKPGGWMFWGCFHADMQGPSLFWEKNWGSINQTSY